MKRRKSRKSYRFADNPEELRFFDAWQEFNRDDVHLDSLLDERPVQHGRSPACSERDQVVAETVIQWLGSPVGQSWLAGLGYKRAAGKERG